MKKEKNKNFIIIVILFIVALTFMTVGFAVYNRALNINGSATVKPDGKIYIKSVVATNTTASATVNPSPAFTDDEITDINSGKNNKNSNDKNNLGANALTAIGDGTSFTDLKCHHDKILNLSINTNTNINSWVCFQIFYSASLICLTILAPVTYF